MCNLKKKIIGVEYKVKNIRFGDQNVTTKKELCGAPREFQCVMLTNKSNTDHGIYEKYQMLLTLVGYEL